MVFIKDVNTNNVYYQRFHNTGVEAKGERTGASGLCFGPKTFHQN